MLFLDSSVFAKFYFREVGSSSFIARATAHGQVLAASVLSFAQVHSAMARKFREKQVSLRELLRLRQRFEQDWSNLVHIVELNVLTMASLPKLVEKFPLKAADAVQLSSALWLKDNMEAEKLSAPENILEFCVADRNLAGVARKYALQVFNPEDES